MPRLSYVAGAAAVLIGTVLSLIPNCDYGYFETDPATGNCAFNCEYDDRYVEASTLSFDFIREVCDDVRFAAIFYPSECASAGDLVWPSGCTVCPYCRCSSETTSVEYNTVTQYVSRECVSNVCQNVTIDEDTGESALARTYDQELSVDDPETWTGFKCPPATCAVGGDASYTQFDMWVPTSSDGTCDDSFCYCDADGNEQCASFADVSSNSSSDAVLKSKFLDECHYYIPDCLDDGSRVVNYLNDCPNAWNACYAKRCDCGDHSVNEEWFTEYVVDDELSDNGCAKCTCVAGNNGNYASCDSSWYGTAECPPQTSLNCHGERSSSLQESVTYTVSELSSSDCSGAGNCGWDIYYHSEDGSPDDMNWGCQSNLFCDFFFVDVVDAPCVYYDEQVEYTDCNGVQRTEIFKGYHSCCSDADNCNHGNIDTTQCVESTVYATIVKELYECVAAVNSSVFFGHQCEADNLEITCEGIENHFVPALQCYCTAYGTMYTGLTSTDTRAQLQQVLNSLGRDLAEWNDVFGCTIVASCDLADVDVDIVFNTTAMHMSTYYSSTNWVIEGPNVNNNGNDGQVAEIAAGLLLAALAIGCAIVLFGLWFQRRKRVKAAQEAIVDCVARGDGPGDDAPNQLADEVERRSTLDETVVPGATEMPGSAVDQPELGNENEEKTDEQDIELAAVDVNLDVSQYKRWSSNQVVHWMVHLNYEAHRQYEGRLRERFGADIVNGRALNGVTEEYLRECGVSSVHCKSINQHLVQLMRGTEIGHGHEDDGGGEGTDQVEGANKQPNDTAASAQTHCAPSQWQEYQIHRGDDI